MLDGRTTSAHGHVRRRRAKIPGGKSGAQTDESKRQELGACTADGELEVLEYLIVPVKITAHKVSS
jgi:hypothetical protein